MDKKFIEKYFIEKLKIKLNLKNGRFYTGIIIKLEEHTVLFKDKFEEEIPIDLDAISYIEPCNTREEEEKWFGELTTTKE